MTEPLTSEEIEALRFQLTGVGTAIGDATDSYPKIERLLAIARDHAQLHAEFGRECLRAASLAEEANDLEAALNALRVEHDAAIQVNADRLAQLDEAKREVERLTTIIGGDLGKRLLLLVEKHEITADALDAAHAQSEKLREAAKGLLTKLTRGNPKYADVWLCKPSDVDALLAALADPTDTVKPKCNHWPGQRHCEICGMDL